MKLILLMLIAIPLLACNKKDEKVQHSKSDDIIIKKADTVESIEKIPVSRKKELKVINSEIIQSLKSKNYEQFSTYIHPKKGVLFSMYGFIQPEKDKIFSKEDFISYVAKPTKFTFGEKDGTGDLLITSLRNYLDTWVFKRDFSEAEFYLDEPKGDGSTINNLLQIYPNARFTENFIPGSKEYSGMDWKALRFVFEEYNGTYYLIAVVNAEYTI